MESKRRTIPGFFLLRPQNSAATASTSRLPGPSMSVVDAPTVTARPLAGGNQTLKAEILWALKCVDSHYSFHSCENLSVVFQRMFPGDLVAQTFSCAETKCRYLCQFGIAPYFRELLKESVKTDGDYVLLFDESLNKVTHNKQLDIHIRLWHHDQVKSRYFQSKFIGHASADDLLLHFSEATEDLIRNGLLQVSMDGPSVNWSFFNKMDRDIKEHQDAQLINIGSCGLHVLHGAFQTGCRETGWKIDNILSSLWYLFKDCPARRQDYITVTDSSDFPLKFCRHRWLVNGPVSSRAMNIWESLKTYIAAVDRKKVARPANNSYSVISQAVKDPLIISQLAFMNSVSKEVEPFLQLYQTDKPMVPFIVTDLYKIIRNLMERCIKGSVIEAASSVSELMKIDLQENKLDNNKLGIGFKAERELSKLKSCKSIGELQAFRVQGRVQKTFGQVA